jgi:RNA polymerase sigma-70 factor (sigma-E family)
MRESIGVDDVEPSIVTRAGDDALPSFDEFVAARSRALWRSAWLLTGDEQKAEDLLQTALVKVWRRWRAISRKGAAEAYARRALVTTYTDWWRRKWRAELVSETVPDRGDEPNATDLADTRRDLLCALAGLSRGQRAVVVLRYFEDLTEAETATTLGCRVGTVKSQHARAIRALRGSPFLFRDNLEEEL